MSAIDFFLIFSVGVAGSFFGNLVGGAGIIIIPVLIALGVEPKTALTAAKVGILAMMVTGGYHFHKEGRVQYSLIGPIVALSSLGALLGALLLIKTPSEVLEQWVGIAILAILVFFAFQPKLGVKEIPLSDLSKKRRFFGYFLFFLDGFWGGFIGAGYIFFATYILLLTFRRTFLESAAITKLQGVAVNVPAVALLMAEGLVDWKVSAVLVGSMMLGAVISTHVGLQKGDAWIRKVFLLAAGTSALTLLF